MELLRTPIVAAHQMILRSRSFYEIQTQIRCKKPRVGFFVAHHVIERATIPRCAIVPGALTRRVYYPDR